MTSAVAFILWNISGKNPEIVSRGTNAIVHGDEVLYLGCTPDRSAYFWLGSGEARWLTEGQLAEAGFILHDYRDPQGLKRRFDGEPA